MVIRSGYKIAGLFLKFVEKMVSGFGKRMMVFRSGNFGHAGQQTGQEDKTIGNSNPDKQDDEIGQFGRQRLGQFKKAIASRSLSCWFSFPVIRTKRLWPLSETLDCCV